MQLKKNLLSAVICIAFAAVNTASAASEYDTDANVAAGVIGTVNTNASFELSPLKWFESEEDFGQDMYDSIYERVKSEGSNIAAKRVLSKRNISQEELVNLIPGLSITEVMQKKQNEELTPQKVEARRREIQAFLAEEKQLADLEVNALLATQPTEFFSNGFEGDSGFDLIADLDVIEKILFGESETPLGNAGPGAPAGSNVADLGRALGGGGNNGGAGANGGQKRGGGGANADGAGANGADSGMAGSGSEEAGIMCPVNQSFNDAIVAQRAQERQGGDAANGAGGGQNAGNGGANGGGLGSREDLIKRGPRGEVLPGTPGDFSREPPCNKIFCIKYEAVYKKDSSYVANANCIACHFEKINDAFKKTFDHNIVPSKATGNFLEGPKCKRSMFNLKQNFILIPQPIMTPPNDDLIVKGDFVKNMQDFFTRYFSARTSRADIAKRVLEQAAAGTDQKEINKRINAEASTEKKKAAELMSQRKVETAAEDQSSQYRVLMQEINQMNVYFENFEKVYSDLTSGDGDSPCKVLQEKSVCS